MFYTLFLGLAVGVAMYFAINGICESYINNKYLSEESRQSREEGYLEDLQSYVDEYALKSTDIDALSGWVRDKGYLYVMIYKDNELVLDSGSAEKVPSGSESGEDEVELPEEKDDTGITVTFPTKEALIEYAKSKGTYPIEMQDGVPLLVAMVDYTQYFYYDIANIVSLFLAAIALMLVLMMYSSRITSRITKLAKQVRICASGEMDRKIKSDLKNGRDEITDLADNVENMRCSMLENIAKEREAINSNTELITSMSHDIRTPLTVLLGYIDIMKGHTGDAAMQEYLDASERCALRLKTMSDDMFNYFLVFGADVGECNFEDYDAATLFEQILSEKILLLREQGYTVDIPMLDKLHGKLDGITVSTDAPKLMRIAENVFSNITKYADKSHPVSIKSKIRGNEITVDIVNKILHSSHKVESNVIGIRTCTKLAELLNIDFAHKRDGDLFRVTLVFKVKGRK